MRVALPALPASQLLSRGAEEVTSLKHAWAGVVEEKEGPWGVGEGVVRERGR